MSFRHMRAVRRAIPSIKSHRRSQRSLSSISQESSYFNVSEEVRAALASKAPVVALETTIYTHGFPSPENVALAFELESLVRANGGIPATIGVLDGVARIGFTPEELVRLLSTAGQQETLKISRRDLSFVLGARTAAGRKYSGGTTIAGTMVLAHLAGIRIFATGGLGGVHRGGENTMDVSADLTELGRTPVAVISSGCKGFLDIPRTLELLETQGVGVMTFADGRQGNVDFPSFWSRESGVRSPAVVKDETEAASLIRAHHSIGLTSGLHLANPVPSEAAIPHDEMEVFIKEAIKQADMAGASGKDNTPFILSKIKELSKGQSIAANRALIASNVIRGSLVAKELAVLELEESTSASQQTFSSPAVAPTLPQQSLKEVKSDVESQPSHKHKQVDIVVAGALAVDYSCDYDPLPHATASPTPVLHTSNPAAITQSLGGVGHNIARAAHLLGSSIHFCSIVGDDLAGQTTLQSLKASQMRTEGVSTLSCEKASRTAQYVAVNDSNKDLVLAMADMGILEHTTQAQREIWQRSLVSLKPKWLVADANWPSDMLHFWLRSAKEVGAWTAYEPVSTAKSTRFLYPSTPDTSLPLFPSHVLDLMTPNALELAVMHATARSEGFLESRAWFSVIDALGIPSSGIRHLLERVTSKDIVDQGVPQMSIQLLPFVPCILTKLGPEGVVLTMLLRKDDSRFREPAYAKYIVSRTNGEDPRSGVGGVYIRHFKPEAVLGSGEVVSVNGAGDTFLGALISEMARTGQRVEDCVAFAQEAARMSLKSKEAVNPELADLRSL